MTGGQARVLEAVRAQCEAMIAMIDAVLMEGAWNGDGSCPHDNVKDMSVMGEPSRSRLVCSDCGDMIRGDGDA